MTAEWVNHSWQAAPPYLTTEEITLAVNVTAAATLYLHYDAPCESESISSDTDSKRGLEKMEKMEEMELSNAADRKPGLWCKGQMIQAGEALLLDSMSTLSASPLTFSRSSLLSQSFIDPPAAVFSVQMCDVVNEIELEKERCEDSSFGNVTSGCQGMWHIIACWPSASVGEVVTITCPTYFSYFSDEHKGNLSKTCTADGWTEMHPIDIAMNCGYNLNSTSDDVSKNTAAYETPQ
ncbi:hypothetical protein NQZ68_027742 [Dissostichus eleginoides]|nr:hypothetical protein NQZ68_027742 [Dissostichus eleginoides]